MKIEKVPSIISIKRGNVLRQQKNLKKLVMQKLNIEYQKCNQNYYASSKFIEQIKAKKQENQKQWEQKQSLKQVTFIPNPQASNLAYQNIQLQSTLSQVQFDNFPPIQINNPQVIDQQNKNIIKNGNYKLVQENVVEECIDNINEENNQEIQTLQKTQKENLQLLKKEQVLIEKILKNSNEKNFQKANQNLYNNHNLRESNINIIKNINSSNQNRNIQILNQSDQNNDDFQNIQILPEDYSLKYQQTQQLVYDNQKFDQLKNNKNKILQHYSKVLLVFNIRQNQRLPPSQIQNLKFAFSYYQEAINFQKFCINQFKTFTNDSISSYKIWGQFIIRQLNVTDLPVYCVIPDPQYIKLNDPDLLKHLVDKFSIPINKINNTLQLIKKEAQRIYDKYYQFKKKNIFNDELNQQLGRQIIVHKYVNQQELNDKELQQQVNESGLIKDQNQKITIFVHKNTLNKLQFQIKQMNKVQQQYLQFYFLFETLFNYEYLLSMGHQMACPRGVMDLLQKNLGFKTELFASPINNHLPYYFSLFESDKILGSLGKYQNLKNIKQDQIINGCLEVNPPFVEKVFVESAQLLTQFLQNCEDKNDKFFVFYVIPWDDFEGFNTLVQNQFHIKTIELQKSNHIFFDACNQKYNQLRNSTYVILLGTTEGKKIWTQEIENQIIFEFNKYQ
ncbi:hypothetical protein PPERSA_02918 [Pseudocohnilembus persalinus]|uniref:PCIF1 WW domain-containing protein n=1 Tax=Pseudocohnilembus persalinus TaxID=266149 RepID=A0A0V0QMH3_PSEPJ|nr:hypothetical protein PPERSA_02918 [Pseudocohnilembus persalinus]|eukprot:KRX03539.1 hypothetical protein PPERSA_02918 [Pseudocohnilembus persalinus]